MDRMVFERVIYNLTEQEVRTAIADFVEEKVGGHIPPGKIKFLSDNSAQVVACETNVTHET